MPALHIHLRGPQQQREHPSPKNYLIHLGMWGTTFKDIFCGRHGCFSMCPNHICHACKIWSAGTGMWSNHTPNSSADASTWVSHSGLALFTVLQRLCDILNVMCSCPKHLACRRKAMIMLFLIYLLLILQQVVKFIFFGHIKSLISPSGQLCLTVGKYPAP